MWALLELMKSNPRELGGKMDLCPPLVSEDNVSPSEDSELG